MLIKEAQFVLAERLNVSVTIAVDDTTLQDVQDQEVDILSTPSTPPRTSRSTNPHRKSRIREPGRHPTTRPPDSPAHISASAPATRNLHRLAGFPYLGLLFDAHFIEIGLGWNIWSESGLPGGHQIATRIQDKRGNSGVILGRLSIPSLPCHQQ